jgi:hypothetical protein
MATLLSGALTSCNENKFLDLKDPNHFTEENFWRNKADAESGGLVVGERSNESGFHRG